jgi:TRAP-type mannitol/chloroaromatic compound transport system permease small subunit
MKFLYYIDILSEYSHRIFRWVAVILTMTVLYEVAARYLFTRPTIWAFDAAMFFYSVLFLMGAAWVLQKGKHIRIDIFFNMFPPRGQAIINLIFYLVFLFPLSLVMIWYGGREAYVSWVSGEISNTSQWGEPIYLWRAILPVAFLLLFLQAIAEFIRVLLPLRRKTDGS